jgi:hypothetical protein
MDDPMSRLRVGWDKYNKRPLWHKKLLGQQTLYKFQKFDLVIQFGPLNHFKMYDLGFSLKRLSKNNVVAANGRP